MAMSNAERHGVSSRMTFRKVDFAEGPEGPFDIVASNPPYIRTTDIADLDPPVRIYGPRRAVDGGADGLAAYRAILARTSRLLAANGFIALEIGRDQSEGVLALCRDARLHRLRVAQDLAGSPRVVWGFRAFA
jgi:release factor glutamine methyltransferase